MQFTLDDTQEELVRSVRGIVQRHDPKVAADDTPVYDTELESALEGAGYLDMATAGGTMRRRPR